MELSAQMGLQASSGRTPGFDADFHFNDLLPGAASTSRRRSRQPLSRLRIGGGQVEVGKGHVRRGEEGLSTQRCADSTSARGSLAEGMCNVNTQGGGAWSHVTGGGAPPGHHTMGLWTNESLEKAFNAITNDSMKLLECLEFYAVHLGTISMGKQHASRE